MKPVEFHPDAETEFAHVAEFYDLARQRLGAEFANEVEQAVQFIRTHSEAGQPIREMIRRWRVQRFPYEIIYREEPERVYILAVAHHRRRPGYWGGRA